MREFLLNTEGLLDRFAVSFLEDALDLGLLPCHWMRFNDRVKLVYFTDGYQSLADDRERLSTDELCEVAIKLLDRVRELEDSPQISLENVVWDEESIYRDMRGRVFFVCLPAVIPEETLRSQIYVKRLYALLSELLVGREEQDLISQIEYNQKKRFGDWDALQEVFVRHLERDDDSTLVLRSINTPRALRFNVGFKDFLVGADAAQVDGVITGVETVSPVHACIGWNEIGHFVCDRGSANGTFVNDHQIAPNIEVPIGKGTVLRFADYTFNVE